ncbi:MAG: hypothetical protein ACLU77_15485 [Waltera sp.]
MEDTLVISIRDNGIGYGCGDTIEKYLEMATYHEERSERRFQWYRHGEMSSQD